LTTLADPSITPAVTTGPITGSAKIYTEVDGLRIPLRRVRLSDGRHVDLYDTSGPYTDPEVAIDVHTGLPTPRTGWIAEREPVGGAVTQLAYAKAA
jgi:phosphomethylpyrimidine synthase